MALQLTGAFKRDALANLQVAAARGGHRRRPDRHRHRHRAGRLLPVQVEKALDRFEALCRHKPRGRGSQRPTTPTRRARRSTSSSRTAGRCGPSGRARRPPSEAPDFAQAGGRLGRREPRLPPHRSRSRPAYRLNHEEVIKSLEEGIRYVERMSPVEAVPDASGAVRAMRFERQVNKRRQAHGHRARSSSCPRAVGLRGRGHLAQHHLREGEPGSASSWTRSGSSSSSTARRKPAPPAHGRRRASPRFPRS